MGKISLTIRQRSNLKSRCKYFNSMQSIHYIMQILHIIEKSDFYLNFSIII